MPTYFPPPLRAYGPTANVGAPGYPPRRLISESIARNAGTVPRPTAIVRDPTEN